MNLARALLKEGEGYVAPKSATSGLAGYSLEGQRERNRKKRGTKFILKQLVDRLAHAAATSHLNLKPQPTEDQKSAGDTTRTLKGLLLGALAKGDLPGHEFHGNQYTGGQGASELATAIRAPSHASVHEGGGQHGGGTVSWSEARSHADVHAALTRAGFVRETSKSATDRQKMGRSSAYSSSKVKESSYAHPAGHTARVKTSTAKYGDTTTRSYVNIDLKKPEATKLFKLLADGDTTRTLKGLLLLVAKGFNPDQERDENGRWTGGGRALLDEHNKPSGAGRFVANPLEQVKGKEIREALGNAYANVIEAYGSVQSVDAKSLRTQQKTVNIDRVQQYVDDPKRVADVAAGRTGNQVVAVSRGGQLGILDGNHRAVAAALRGEKISVKVVDMDQAFKDAKEWQAKNPAHGIGSALMHVADQQIKARK